MASRYRSFTESEKKALLAEILSQSTLKPYALVKIVDELQIVPNWDDIVPPPGRSVSDCKKALQEIRDVDAASSSPQRSTFNLQTVRTAISSTEAVTPKGRLIQPRPSQLHSSDLISPDLSQAASTEVPPKKRGRPSNEIRRQREQDAAARGEVYVSKSSKRAKVAQKAGQTEDGMTVGVAVTAPTAFMTTSTVPIRTETSPATAIATQSFEQSHQDQPYVLNQATTTTPSGQYESVSVSRSPYLGIPSSRAGTPNHPDVPEKGLETGQMQNDTSGDR